jgi:hypothetical protein
VDQYEALVKEFPNNASIGANLKNWKAQVEQYCNEELPVTPKLSVRGKRVEDMLTRSVSSGRRRRRSRKTRRSRK